MTTERGEEKPMTGVNRLQGYTDSQTPGNVLLRSFRT